MITLDIRPYCDNCENFEAEVNKICSCNGHVITSIRCTNDNKCREIKNYLENYKEKKNESTN